MKLCMIGTGYVGLVSGVCFSDMGNIVYCVDKDQKKIEQLNKGIVPIYEPGLNEVLSKNYKQKRLIFTSDIKNAVHNSDIIFICVGTPTKKNSNSANLKYVFAASLGAISYLLVSVQTPSQLSPGGLLIKCSHRGM